MKNENEPSSRVCVSPDGAHVLSLRFHITWHLVLLLAALLLCGGLSHADGHEALSAGHHHTCVATESGEVRCWGLANHGRLGVAPSTAARSNGAPDPRNFSDVVRTLPGQVALVALGGEMSCAEASDLVPRCWGRNNFGQLGTGSSEPHSFVPTPVKDLAGVTSLSVGASSACAARAQGGVSCWGRNNYGQLGDGSRADRNTPVAVQGLEGAARDVSVGDDHACAVVSGLVRCWGRNDRGQLGNGSKADSSVPVSVQEVQDATSVYAGSGVSYAVTSTGAVKMWGWGTVAPIDFSVLSHPVTALALGELHGCALTTSGAVLCWGSNSKGQLGDGSTTDRLEPVEVLGLTSGVVSIAAGKEHSCALKKSGQVLCWGAGAAGQIGDGSTTLKVSAAVPQVAGIEGGGVVSIPRMCGTGVATKDSDADGVPDCSDGCPTNGALAAPVKGSCEPRASAAPVVSRADLALATVEAPRSTKRGSVWRLSGRIVNVGTEPSPLGRITWYLSRDNALSEATDISLGVRQVGGLKPGAAQAVVLSVNAKRSRAVPAGRYWVIGVLSEGVISSLGAHDNNVRVSAGQITVAK